MSSRPISAIASNLPLTIYNLGLATLVGYIVHNCCVVTGAFTISTWQDRRAIRSIGGDIKTIVNTPGYRWMASTSSLIYRSFLGIQVIDQPVMFFGLQ